MKYVWFEARGERNLVAELLFGELAWRGLGPGWAWIGVSQRFSGLRSSRDEWAATITTRLCRWVGSTWSSAKMEIYCANSTHGWTGFGEPAESVRRMRHRIESRHVCA